LQKTQAVPLVHVVTFRAGDQGMLEMSATTYIKWAFEKPIKKKPENNFSQYRPFNS